jgi:hypothetical protein
MPIVIDERMEANRQAGKHKIRLILKTASAITLCLALLSAVVVVALRLTRKPEFKRSRSVSEN